jgi:hypothetical protein
MIMRNIGYNSGLGLDRFWIPVEEYGCPGELQYFSLA